MFLKLNSATVSPDNVYANNNQSRILVVQTITFSSNVDKSFTLAYENGDTIGSFNALANRTQTSKIEGAVANSNQGKDIVILVEGEPLTGGSEINVFLDIKYINAPIPS